MTVITDMPSFVYIIYSWAKGEDRNQIMEKTDTVSI